MVSADNLLIYTYWTIPFTVNTDDSNKKLGVFISKNIKPIELFSRRLSRTQSNYTMDEKVILVIF